MKEEYNNYTNWQIILLIFYFCIYLFYLRYSSISEIIELIYLVFNNFFFSNNYQIILEIVNSNLIVWFIFNLKFYLLFFKNGLSSSIQNLIPIIIKYLLAFFIIK